MEIKDFRIGNDLPIEWSITFNDEPYPLVKEDTKLFLTRRTDKFEITDYTIKGNTISFTFWGKDQNLLGKYFLTLLEKDGERGMRTVNSCPAFNLVGNNCGLEPCPLTPQTLHLLSNICGGMRGMSAYQSAVANGFVGTEQEWLESLVGLSIYQLCVKNGTFVGTEEEFVKQYNDSVNAAKDAAANAQKKVDEIITVVNQNEETRISSENNRIQNENARSEKETQRETAETERKNSEDARKLAEQARKTETDEALKKIAQATSESNTATKKSQEVTKEAQARLQELSSFEMDITDLKNNKVESEAIDSKEYEDYFKL